MEMVTFTITFLTYCHGSYETKYIGIMQIVVLRVHASTQILQKKRGKMEICYSFEIGFFLLL